MMFLLNLNAVDLYIDLIINKVVLAKSGDIELPETSFEDYFIDLSFIVSSSLLFMNLNWYIAIIGLFALTLNHWTNNYNIRYAYIVTDNANFSRDNKYVNLMI